MFQLQINRSAPRIYAVYGPPEATVLDGPSRASLEEKHEAEPPQLPQK